MNLILSLDKTSSCLRKTLACLMMLLPLAWSEGPAATALDIDIPEIDVASKAKRVTLDGRKGLMLSGFHPILTDRPRFSPTERERGAWKNLVGKHQVPEETFRVKVSDGELILEFFNEGGKTPDWYVNALTISKIAADGKKGSPIHAFDFGPAKSKVAPGYTLVTPETTSGKYRWKDSSELKSEAGYWRLQDILRRDFIHSSKPGRFEIDLQNGEYEVTVTVENFDKDLDKIAIRAEGTTVRSDIRRRRLSGEERIFRAKVEEIAPYLQRHQLAPDDLMSRMPMHWRPGKHYTHFPISRSKENQITSVRSPHALAAPISVRSGKHLSLDELSGNAPVPTIQTTFGQFQLPKGYPALRPFSFGNATPNSIEVPRYNEGVLFPFKAQGTGEKRHHFPLQSADLVSLMKEASSVASKSAWLYYISDEEKYAEYACDYLMQFVLAVYFQDENSIGSFLAAHAKSDAEIQFTSIYDLCIDYLKENEQHYLSGDFYPHRKGEVDHQRLKEAMRGKSITDVVDTAFYKFSGAGFKMVINNNLGVWAASTLVRYPLVIENDELRALAMDGLIYSRRWHQPNGKQGLLPIAETIENNVSAEGLWKESPSYASIASNRLLGYLDVLTNVGGYRIRQDYPQIFRRQIGRVRMMFPNRMSPAYGDSEYSPIRDVGGILDQYRSAVDNGASQSELQMHRHAVKWAIDNGMEKPLSAAEMKQLPQKPHPLLTRSDYLKYSDLFLQRNGALDQQHGMMSTIYGAHVFSHAQADGINFELYAQGTKVVAHNGYGGWGSPLHHYNSAVGCKNTVIPAGQKISRAEQSVRQQLIGMEPMPRQVAVSPSMSFIEVERDYAGKQRRNMAMIRTSPTSGFWVDVFRSSNPKSNEYRLHSIGQKISISEDGSPVPLVADPGHRNAALGDDFLEDRMMSNQPLSANLLAQFSIQNPDKQVDLDFNVCMLGRKGYKVFTNTGPPRRCAGDFFRKIRSPSLFVEFQGEAWNRPFVSVFEVTPKGKTRISSIKRLSDGPLTALEVIEDGDTYIILSSESPELKHRVQEWFFQGTFAVIKKAGKKSELYLGKGRRLSNRKVQIASTSKGEISASFRVTDKGGEIYSVGGCQLLFNGKKTRVKSKTMTPLSP